MNNLRKLRREQNLTMKKLGKLFLVGESTVSMWETGKREPDFETIKKLAEFFNVSTDYLLDNTDDPTPPGQNEDDEFWEFRREMAERSEMKTLFSLARGATKKDLEFANDLLKRLKGGDDEE